jgi:hypothetical protein
MRRTLVRAKVIVLLHRNLEVSSGMFSWRYQEYRYPEDGGDMLLRNVTLTGMECY